MLGTSSTRLGAASRTISLPGESARLAGRRPRRLVGQGARLGSDPRHSASPRGTSYGPPSLVESELRSGLPALAVLLDFSVLGEPGQNPVEVVGGNSHLLGH